MEFTQQVFIDGRKEAEESGYVLFLDPSQLKWEYTRPERKVFLLAGARFQFYQPEIRQLLRGRVDRAREKMLWQLLADDIPAVDYRCDAKRRSIAIRSGSGEDALDLVVLVGPDGLPLRAEQADPAGVQQVFSFRRYRGPLPLTPADFALTVPPGTEIIDE